MHVYRMQGTCARELRFEVEGGVLKSAGFVGGCTGYARAIVKALEGRPVAEIIPLLAGIPCRNGTSCPDQFALALRLHAEGRLPELPKMPQLTADEKQRMAPMVLAIYEEQKEREECKIGGH